MQTSVVIAVLLMLAFLSYAVPAYARLTRSPEAPAVADPEVFPVTKTIKIPANLALSEEEKQIILTWLSPLTDSLPDGALVWVARHEPDRWLKQGAIHIFLLNGVCMIGAGKGGTFEQAAESLVQNLLRQGYRMEERPLTVNLPVCKPEEQYKEGTP